MQKDHPLPGTGFNKEMQGWFNAHKSANITSQVNVIKVKIF